MNPITEAQISIELGPNHERWRSWRDQHRRWESREERPRCRTITEHVVGSSRTKTFERCRD